MDRRQFIKLSAGLAAAGTAAYAGARLTFLEAASGVANPLQYYPNRGWERLYRDQYAYDSSFTFVCAPNCTHNCRLRAFVRNGVVIRTEQNYDCQDVGDPAGNFATAAWNPRGCNKGATLTRRIYGPYRLRGPMIRKGWKAWADDGFPPLDAQARSKYLFDARGRDTFVNVTWDEAFRYAARGLEAVARRYSGEEGKRILLEEGYQPEMVEEMGGAGTRTFKLRGGMGLLGVLGKYGMYRMSNMMALLDVHVRGVPPEQARGGRNWSNYTWHGDQAPGTPFVTGLQNSDCDFNDMRNARLHIGVGKNLVENKMADAHFFIELMERGGKIVTITPEYSPPATKADYWIPCRPGLGDTAIFLAIARILMDRNLYDADFVKRFTDLPLLIRTDTLKRLDPRDIFPGYRPALDPNGPSFKVQGLTSDQYAKLQDYVVYDAKSRSLQPITRDDVGDRLTSRGIDPQLEYSGAVRTLDGRELQVTTLWEAYRLHLRDYDVATAAEISGAPAELIERLALDIATIKPVAIHVGEGINHWFHATLHNRAVHLPLMLTGNVGRSGAGMYSWAGNYKAALFQGTPETGPGFKGWIAEDPFEPNLDPSAPGRDIKAHAYTKDEEPAFWDHGDRALIVDTPKYGRKVFTGKTHMPTPTKVIWTTNVNLINNAKWLYMVIFNVLPKIDMIITQDIEMTLSCEYSDFVLPANSWLETQQVEVTASCQNPFLQIWKGGIHPIFDTKDDIAIMAGVARALAELTGDERFANYWKFALEGRADIYLQRLLDSSGTTSGYRVDDILAGKYGEPGSALMLFRSYPRVPYYEQIHDNIPFHTDTGRMNSYCDIPEAIEYGENFIVHREGPEATPYLPNVIVSSNPLIRPEDYGIPPEDVDPEHRTIRNIKLPWAQVKQTKNPLWEQGFRFYFLTPKTRHTVHSSWSVTDWMNLYATDFTDPYRADRRMASVGDQQLHMNPEDARELGVEEGDYVWVDANPADRPFFGWTPDDPRYKVARLMLRVKINPAYPRGVVMTKHGGFGATEKTVLAHETRADGRAVSADTGYQSNFRYGSHQSVTRDWSMPMHMTDHLFHKAKVAQAFIFGGEADNHAVNTVPKETLVRITKAEDGGLNGQGKWATAQDGMSPSRTSPVMDRYLAGNLVTVRRA
ncbi:MAG: molybdopterin oxidoreductase [Tepidiforma sp.]|nr:MAG: molybdopterin oxidoreductase [Tepidiforma sp.]GIW56886.1 MAG: molybdopterin oxidoreductase [Nitrospiraceae bacterium]